MFNFNYGQSKTSSQSSSLDLGASAAQSESRGASQSTAIQNVAFEDIFQKLYGGATAAAGQSALLAPTLTDQAQALFSGGTKFLDALQQGTDYLGGRVAGESPVLAEQINALGGDIGKFLQEQILPGITSQGVATGTLGGGRQGVAQGLAAEAATRQFQQGATSLRAQDIAARDAAAGQLGGLATQGIAGATGLYGLAQAGSLAGLAPYQSLAGILGGPTVLTQQQATSEDIAKAISASFQYGTSQSTSSGKSFNIGGGFGGGGGGS
jgi:hypothetical protein